MQDQSPEHIAQFLLRHQEDLPGTFYIVYGFSGRYRVLRNSDHEMEKFQMPTHAWRIIGRYTNKVGVFWVADDIQAFLDEAGSQAG